MIKFIFYLSLIIFGMFVMRFGIIQIRQYKQGKTKIKSIEWLYLAAIGHRLAIFDLINNKENWLFP